MGDADADSGLRFLAPLRRVATAKLTEDLLPKKTKPREQRAWSRQGRGRLLPTHQLDIEDIWQI